MSDGPSVGAGASPRTSWLFEHGFEPLDVVAASVGLFLCVAYGSFFLIPSWTPRMTVLLVTAPLGFVFMLIQAVRRDAIAVVSVVLIAVAIVSGLATGDARSTLMGTFGTEESVLILVSCLGLLAIGRETTTQGRRATGWAVVVGASMSCAVGLAQYIAKAERGIFAMISERASGLTANPVYFGAVAAGAFGIVVARQTENRRTVWLDAALASWFGIAISISGTRVAFGAAIVVGVVVVLARRTGRSLLVLGGLLVGLVAGAIITTIMGSGQNAATRVGSGSSGDRRTLWADALGAFRERPVLGWGLGEFRRAMQGQISIETSNRFGNRLELTMFDAHNTVVGVAVSLGVAGLICLAVLVVLIARRARGGLAVGAGALALSWMLQPMGLATFPLALLLVGASLPPVPARATIGSVQSIEPVRPNAGLVTHRALLWFLLPGLAAGVYLSAVEVSISRASLRSDPERVESLVEVLPPDPVLADLVARSWQRDGSPSDPETMERMIYWSERARDLQDDSSRWWVRLAVRQYFAGDATAALASVRQGRALEPNSWSAVDVEMALLDALGHDDEFDALTPLACELGVPTCPS